MRHRLRLRALERAVASKAIMAELERVGLDALFCEEVLALGTVTVDARADVSGVREAIQAIRDKRTRA